MEKLTIKQDVGFSDFAFIFVKPWITMLAIGALGHRLVIPYLFRFGYWDVFLLGIALSVFKTGYVNRWKIEWGKINVFLHEAKKGKK